MGACFSSGSSQPFLVEACCQQCGHLFRVTYPLVLANQPGSCVPNQSPLSSKCSSCGAMAISHLNLFAAFPSSNGSHFIPWKDRFTNILTTALASDPSSSPFARLEYVQLANISSNGSHRQSPKIFAISNVGRIFIVPKSTPAAVESHAHVGDIRNVSVDAAGTVVISLHSSPHPIALSAGPSSSQLVATIAQILALMHRTSSPTNLISPPPPVPLDISSLSDGGYFHSYAIWIDFLSAGAQWRSNPLPTSHLFHFAGTVLTRPTSLEPFKWFSPMATFAALRNDACVTDVCVDGGDLLGWGRIVGETLSCNRVLQNLSIKSARNATDIFRPPMALSQSLRHVSISATSISEAAALTLAAALKSNPSVALETFELTGSRLSPQCWAAVLDALTASSASLRTLGVSNVEWPLPAWPAFVERLQRLKKLLFLNSALCLENIPPPKASLAAIDISTHLSADPSSLQRIASLLSSQSLKAVAAVGSFASLQPAAVVDLLRVAMPASCFAHWDLSRNPSLRSMLPSLLEALSPPRPFPSIRFNEIPFDVMSLQPAFSILSSRPFAYELALDASIAGPFPTPDKLCAPCPNCRRPLFLLSCPSCAQIVAQLRLPDPRAVVDGLAQLLASPVAPLTLSLRGNPSIMMGPFFGRAFLALGAQTCVVRDLRVDGNVMGDALAFAIADTIRSNRCR